MDEATTLETTDRFELAEIGRLRDLYIKTLEENYPTNQALVTAQDIMDLQFTNALLSQIDRNLPLYTSPDKHEDEEDIAYLRSLRDTLSNKIIRITALALVREYRYFGRGSLRSEFSDTNIAQLDAVVSSQLPYDKDDPRTAYRERLEFIEQILLDGTITQSQLQNLLQLLQGKSGSEKAWQNIGNVAYEASRRQNEGKTTRVERLLTMLHSGNQPILQYITDRPWEGANVLTCVFTGTQNACPTKPSSAVIQIAKKLRMYGVVQEYLSTDPVSKADIEHIGDDVSERYGLFQDALIFNPRIPVELLLLLYAKIHMLDPAEFNAREYRYQNVSRSLTHQFETLDGTRKVLSRVK